MAVKHGAVSSKDTKQYLFVIFYTRVGGVVFPWFDLTKLTVVSGLGTSYFVHMQVCTTSNTNITGYYLKRLQFLKHFGEDTNMLGCDVCSSPAELLNTFRIILYGALALKKQNLCLGDDVSYVR